MKLKVIKQGASPIGTSYKGEFSATKAQIESLFGQPTKCGSGDKKAQFSWEFGIVVDDDIVPITIYDWKESKEISDNDVIIWCVGAFKEKHALLFIDYINSELKKS